MAGSGGFPERIGAHSNPRQSGFSNLEAFKSPTLYLAKLRALDWSLLDSRKNVSEPKLQPRILNEVKPVKGRQTMARRRVVITGTFDILHPGHIFLISEAAKLGEVIVVVARDQNVQRAKGHPAIVPEEQRRFMVEALKGVRKAILGSEHTDLFRVIEQLAPDILLLGPNQEVSTEEVQRELQHRNVKAKVRRLEGLFKGYPLSSTSAIVDRVLATRKSGQ